MKIKWTNRLTISIQIFALTTSAALTYASESGTAFFGAVFFITGCIILLSFTLIQSTLDLLQTPATIKEAYQKFILTLFMLLLNIHLFACLYYMFGINSNKTVIINDWYNSYYFSIVTWTTVGYGDFSPTSEMRLVAAFEAFLGYIYMAVIVGLFLKLSVQQPRNI